jgi:phosphatidate phosphatase APP1
MRRVQNVPFVISANGQQMNQQTDMNGQFIIEANL